MPLFRFVQLDLPGRLGIADGRYLAHAGDEKAVVVSQTLGAPAPTKRSLRRGRPRPADAAEPAEVPLTRLTATAADALIDEGAAREWLGRVTRDHDRAAEEIAAGLELINRAIHAHRTAAGDPHIPDASSDHALAVRLGWGTGEQVADSEWTEAVEIPAAARRSRRLDEVRPQERIAAALTGRDRIDACEALLLRARADHDAGREREAAMQLRIGIEALLAEVAPTAGADQSDDIAALEARQARVAGLAHEALHGEPGDGAVAELEQALRIAERVLRRRAILG